MTAVLDNSRELPDSCNKLLEKAVERMLEMEKMLEDGMQCLKKRKMEKGRTMETWEDLPEVFTFHVTLTHSATFYQWRDIGTMQQLATDEDIACFLMECYDKGRRDSPSGSTTCTKCRAPLKLLCAQCDAESTLTSKRLLGRSCDNISFHEVGSTSPQQSSRAALGDTERQHLSHTKSKSTPKTTRRRKTSEEIAAQNAVMVKLEVDEPNPTGTTASATTHQQESSSGRATTSATLATTPASGNLGRLPCTLSPAYKIPSPGTEDSRRGNLCVVADDKDVESFLQEAEARSLSASEESESRRMLEVESGEEEGGGGGEEERKCRSSTRRSGTGPVGAEFFQLKLKDISPSASEENNSRGMLEVKSGRVDGEGGARGGKTEGKRRSRTRQSGIGPVGETSRDLVCPMCGRAMASKRSLLYHMDSQHPEAVLPACIARLSSARKDEDEAVQQARMEKVKARLKRRAELESLTCGTCGKKFENKVKMSSHLKQCTWKVCDLCGKSVKDLDMHLKRHVAPKRFQCPHCPKVYLFKTYLDTHLLYHNRERPFCCEVCGARYYEKFRLTSHIRTHTGVKPFKCGQCDARFTRKRGLSDHMRVHTGEKPYACQVCGRQFSSTGNLAAHRRKVHKMEPQAANPTRSVLNASTATTNTNTDTNTVFGTVAETAAKKSKKFQTGLGTGTQGIETGARTGTVTGTRISADPGTGASTETRLLLETGIGFGTGQAAGAELASSTQPRPDHWHWI